MSNVDVFVPPAKPTQTGPEGILYDFNSGCRVWCPKREDGAKWHVKIFDGDKLIEHQKLTWGLTETARKYFQEFRFEVWAYYGIAGFKLIFEHSYKLFTKTVLVYFASTALGDTLAWVPACDQFQQKHHCHVTVVCNTKVTELFGGNYPNLTFMSHEAFKKDQTEYYASYYCGLYLNDKKKQGLPVNCRDIGLHFIPNYLMGIEPVETRPKLAVDYGEHPYGGEPYVCIATLSTAQAKHWNNPAGWHEVVKFLKDAGYRVVDIDRDMYVGRDTHWNHIPWGVKNDTGDKPLSQRCKMLYHCDFFVGLPSGLSWLAWAVNKPPVVMISGFSQPHSEFYTPYRVGTPAGCTGCWNDHSYSFDNFDHLWCPRHKNKPKMFECTRIISSNLVKDMIRKIPGFRGAVEKPRPKLTFNFEPLTQRVSR